MSQELADYIAAENAETRAWVAEDPENRWATTWAEDLEFWAGMGITTVEQFRRSNAIQAYSDLYKEMNGIRPRWMDWTGATADEIETEVDKLFAVDAARQERERAEQARIDAAYAATREEPEALTYNPFADLLGKK